MMMDWRGVAGNGLWILGLSILLGAFSYYNWLAAVSRRSRRDVFTDSPFRVFSSLAVMLILIGWALGQADHLWERAFYFVVAAFCGWDIVRLVQSRGDRS
jgi:hypothetical protein